MLFLNVNVAFGIMSVLAFWIKILKTSKQIMSIS